MCIRDSPESDLHPIRTLKKISSLGVEPGIALNPETSIESVAYLLGYIKYLLVMTVTPGFSGQEYLNFMDRKIAKLLEYKKEYGFTLILDGACSYDVIQRHHTDGVDGFILGSSVLFGKAESYKDIISKLRKIH